MIWSRLPSKKHAEEFGHVVLYERDGWVLRVNGRDKPLVDPTVMIRYQPMDDDGKSLGKEMPPANIPLDIFNEMVEAYQRSPEYVEGAKAIMRRSHRLRRYLLAR